MITVSFDAHELVAFVCDHVERLKGAAVSPDDISFVLQTSRAKSGIESDCQRRSAK